MGWHFAIVWEEAGNLITAVGSVSFCVTLAASTCVGSETIDLQTYDLVQICRFHVLFEFEVRFWRASRTFVSDVASFCHRKGPCRLEVIA